MRSFPIMRRLGYPSVYARHTRSTPPGGKGDRRLKQTAGPRSAPLRRPLRVRLLSESTTDPTTHFGRIGPSSRRTLLDLFAR